MMKSFTNALLLTEAGVVKNKALLVETNKINAIIDPADIPVGAEQIDCKGNYLAPGLIDLQIYGSGGYLFSNKPSAEALQAITDAIVKSGTTHYMLTLATNSMEVFREAIRVVKHNPHPALLGLHFEGPYINPLKRGAHLQQYIKKPEKEEVQSLLAEAEGVLKMMTLAPEVTDPFIIRLLLDHGVLISAGHSNATYAEAMQGFQNGIQATTHLFNAMSPLHHRDTGLPGATFLSDAYASIIADGIHVDFPTLIISKKQMQERLFLITDAVEEVLEGAYVHVRQKDRFTLPDGTLSGSQLTLLQAVKNCVQQAGIAIEEAVRMASLYPARLIGAADLGRIEAGAKANLVVFDKEFRLTHVYAEGNPIRL